MSRAIIFISYTSLLPVYKDFQNGLTRGRPSCLYPIRTGAHFITIHLIITLLPSTLVGGHCSSDQTRYVHINFQFPSTMLLSLSLPPLPYSSSSLHPHAHFSPSLLPMSILRRLTRPLPHARHLNLRRHRFATVAAAAVRQDTTIWTQAPLSEVEPAAESLFHVTVDLSDSPDLAASHTCAGQYLQLRVPDVSKPSFLAIASPPKLASGHGVFEFLVKSVAGSTAENLCGLKKGDVVELSQVMGNGFDTSRIDPPEKYSTVLIFATGSGIR